MELVHGVSGLAALIDEVLIPSVPVISRLFGAIAERNAKLDEEAATALRDLIVKAGEVGRDFNRVLKESLTNAYKDIRESHYSAISDVLCQIDNLESLDSDGHAKVMIKACEVWGDVQKEEVKAQGKLHHTFVKTIGYVVVIVVAGLSYKHARPKTIGEVIEDLVKHFSGKR